jgi:hypothetical protein
MVRTALYEAASVTLSRTVRLSPPEELVDGRGEAAGI